MLGFVTRFFRSSEGASDSAHHPSHGSQLYAESQRELVRAVLKQMVQQHGIPRGCLDSEVTALAARAGKTDLIIQLIVLQWNEVLLRCVQAIERDLLMRLDRFDPGVNHSKYKVVWSFASDCGAPLVKMPAPEMWMQPASTPARKFDLPLSEKDFMNDDFAATVPGPLRR